jgi:hypothetical protein
MAIQRTAGNASVAHLLGARRGAHDTGVVAAGAAAVQRFDSPEHVALGDSATLGPLKDTTGIRYDENPDDELSFGEMVAMAGDYFGSLNQMKQLSQSPEGRQQLAYARSKVTNSSPPTVSAEAKKAVDDRYYTLASKNRSHFAGGGNAQEAYETGHMEALASAWMSGHENNQSYFTDALAAEAFCDHFLTDMFSSGHIRTPRASIQDYYSATFPKSVDQMKDFLKNYLVRRLNALNPNLANVPDFLIAQQVDSILDDMAGSALASFGVGDLVSLAMHDYDNQRGVKVVSQSSPDGTPGEFHWTAFGDKQIGSGGGEGDRATTFNMASAGVKASRAELDAARALGTSAASQHLEWYQLEPAAIAATNTLAPFKALPYVPREDVAATRPGASADMTDGPLGDWHWGKFSSEMRAAFEAAIRDEVVGKITAAAGTIPEPKQVMWGAMTIHARQAVVDLGGQINRAPLTTFEEIFGPAGP